MDSRDENDPTNHHDRAFPDLSRRSIQQVAAMTRVLSSVARISAVPTSGLDRSRALTCDRPAPGLHALSVEELNLPPARGNVEDHGAAYFLAGGDGSRFEGRPKAGC